MSGASDEDFEGFLRFLEGRGDVSALDAEKLRSEFIRRKSTEPGLTFWGLLVHKGVLTLEQVEHQYGIFSGGKPLPQPKRAAPMRHPTRRLDDLRPKSGDNRPTGRLPEPPARKRPPTEPTRKQDPLRGAPAPSDSDWSGGSDDMAETDKIAKAGTVIAGGQVTVAQVREQVGISEGVKLVSDKMASSVAHLQPDAAADKKRYVVIREIARGGMGKVLEVEDTELRRSVALKVLRKELLNRGDVVERFLEEAQITGQLEHPNIVPVHEMGVDGAGNLYFTMKFVEGLSLAEILLKLREGNRDAMRDYPLPRLLDIFIKMCEGISFAHNRGVIHRDLKPANIMVGKFGEVLVMDWGVAKVVGRAHIAGEGEGGVVVTDRLDRGSIHTMMGSVIGTPSYMSPEQARSDHDATGPATDIFSLGVILYEILCLRSPWTGKTSDEVLVQVREYKPVRPAERNPAVSTPAELERLALKCLEKDPSARVTSVKELADNVRLFIEGRAMGSVEYSAFRLALKWVGRHRKEVLGVLLSVLLIAGGILGTVWALQKFEQDRILGLNDDAEQLLERWQRIADNASPTDDDEIMQLFRRARLAPDNEGDFDKAETTIDEARELFQRVLAVDSEDPRANDGMVEVGRIMLELRRLRGDFQRDRTRRDEVNRLLVSAEAALRRAGENPLFAEENLTEAFGMTQAALALDSTDQQARRLNIRVCRAMTLRAMSNRRYELARYWVNLWKTAGPPEQDRSRILEIEAEIRRHIR